MALDLYNFLSQWQNTMKSAFVLNERSNLDTTPEGMSRIRDWWASSDNLWVVRLFMSIDSHKLPETPKEALQCYVVARETNEYITQKLKRENK